MPIDLDNTPSLLDNHAFVVDPDGTCVLHTQLASLEGEKPWDWCVTADRPGCREWFVRSCMFRERTERFECRMRYRGREIRVSMRLFPLGGGRGCGSGQVLCTYHRVFDAELTARERNVLSLIAAGASTHQAAETLSLSPSTVRDYVASLKKKLRVDSPQGFAAAARHYEATRAGSSNGGAKNGALGESS